MQLSDTAVVVKIVKQGCVVAFNSPAINQNIKVLLKYSGNWLK